MKLIQENFMAKMPVAVSVNQILYNDKGVAVDYQLIQVNEYFEKTLGLTTEELAGEKMSRWLFNCDEIPAPWDRAFSETVFHGSRSDFEQFLEINGDWYLLSAFVPSEGFLVVFLYETVRLKMAQIEFNRIETTLRAHLKDSRAFSKTVFDNTPSSIIVYEVLGNGDLGNDYIIRAVNRACLEVEGWQEEAVLGQPLGVVRPGVDRFGILEVFKHVWQTGQTAHYPARVYQENDEYRWFENIVFKLPTNEIVAIYEDVTSNKLAEEALFAEKEKLQVTLSSIGDGVITTDLKGIVEFLNPVAEELTGWTLQEAKGRPLATIFDTYDEFSGEPCKNPVDMVLEIGNRVGVAHHSILKARDGKRRIIYDNASPIKDSRGQILGVILVFRDVTKAKEQEAQIRFLSYNDPLTGLHNRAFFESEFAKLDIEKNYPLALILGDLDGLKLINDAFGYETGDLALVKIGEIVRTICQDRGLVFRWGGDELLLLLPKTTEMEAQEICDQIKEQASLTRVADTQLQISLGCALKTKGDQSREEMLRTAENNMYKAKLLGAKSYRNVVLASFQKTLHEKSHETQEHGRRLGKFCRQIGEVLGLSALHLDELEVFSMLHDIGKIGITEQILQKPGKLTEEEWTIMHTS